MTSEQRSQLRLIVEGLRIQFTLLETIRRDVAKANDPAQFDLNPATADLDHAITAIRAAARP